MPPTTAAVLSLALAVLLLPGCATSRNSSEAQWRRGQCAQINDKDAREKCEKRVDQEYGRQ
jgi:hypothetical protein